MYVAEAPARRVRALSPFELSFAACSATLWYAAVLRGPLDVAALREAFTALRRANPVLAGRVESSAQGFELIVDEAVEPVVRVGEGEFDGRFRPVDPTAHLVELDVVSQGDRHWVSVGVSHVVADARPSYWYFLSLLSLYTELVATGSAGDSAVRPIPVSPESTLLERGIVKGEDDGTAKLVGVASLLVDSEGPPVAGDGLAKQHLEFDQQMSEALRGAGKARGVSLHGVVAGAVVTAARALLDGNSGPVDLGVSSQVDLRARVGPLVEIDAATNLVGMAYAKIKMRPDSDPIELGKSVVDQLRLDLADGVVQQYGLHKVDMTGRRDEPPETVGISNLGELMSPQTPQDLVVEDVIGDMEIGPSVVAKMLAPLPEEQRPPAMCPTFAVYSALGKLKIQLMYFEPTFPQARAERLMAGIATTLRAIAATARLD